MTYTVYHTRNGIVSIMWCLHRSIEEKHFMSRLLCGYSRKKHEKDTGIYSESAEGGSNSRAARTGDRRSVYGK